MKVWGAVKLIPKITVSGIEYFEKLLTFDIGRAVVHIHIWDESLIVAPNEAQSEPPPFNDTEVLLPSVADKSELFCWNLF